MTTQLTLRQVPPGSPASTLRLALGAPKGAVGTSLSASISSAPVLTMPGLSPARTKAWLGRQTTESMERGASEERDCRARGVARWNERPRSRCLSFAGPGAVSGPEKRVCGGAESGASEAPQQRGSTEALVADSGCKESRPEYQDRFAQPTTANVHQDFSLKTLAAHQPQAPAFPGMQGLVRQLHRRTSPVVHARGPWPQEAKTARTPCAGRIPANLCQDGKAHQPHTVFSFVLNGKPRRAAGGTPRCPDPAAKRGQQGSRQAIARQDRRRKGGAAMQVERSTPGYYHVTLADGDTYTVTRIPGGWEYSNRYERGQRPSLSQCLYYLRSLHRQERLARGPGKVVLS